MILIYMIFTIPLILSTLVAMSASSPIYMWAALEINTISFIPMMISSYKPETLRSAMKYFFVQAYASLILLLGPILYISFSVSIIIAMLIKMGAAPFHNWYPSVMMSMQWMPIFILSTWQKIAPLWILMENMNSFLYANILASIGALIGGLGGLAQSEIRGLLAFSSVGHMGWLLYSMMYSNFITFIYYLSYLLHLTVITYIFMNYFISSPKDLNHLSPSSYIWKYMLPLSLLSMAGMPPLFGFIPKFMILNLATLSMVVPIMLILGSYLNIYFYMNLMWTSFMTNIITYTNQIKYTTLLSSTMMICLTGLIMIICGLNMHFKS